MDTQRVLVCKVNDLNVGELRQFTVADKEILLAHTGDGFHATAAHCSHSGAPLAKGVLHNDRIVCPWHNACFSAASGQLLNAPGRDNLNIFNTEVTSDNVYVDLPQEITEHLPPTLVLPDSEQDNRTFVIVGGGAAGEAAAQMLRQVKFQGKIIMLTAEDYTPYDRTKLSKAYLQSDEVEDPSLLRPTDFYEQHGVEIKTSAPVTLLDVENQQVTYGEGNTLKYDKILIATGGKVNKLPVDGAELDNVFTLRKAADAKAILQAASTANKAVVVGSGFIGMEVAASLKQKGLDVTVVAPNKVPFKKVLGEPIGKLFQQVHESKGVKFKLGEKATAIKGDGSAEAVELESGETLPADLVVVGIGVKPATDFVEGLLMDEDDNSILVNQYLQATPGVYAAGDIAQFPHFITGQPTRIEHWQLAMQQGRIAACNMAGQQVTFKAVPFFWTGQFDLKLRYIGHSENYDDIIIQGSLQDKSFLAFYIQEGQAMAVSGIGRDRDIAAISERLRLRDMPSPDELRAKDIDWANELGKVKVSA